MTEEVGKFVDLKVQRNQYVNEKRIESLTKDSELENRFWTFVELEGSIANEPKLSLVGFNLSQEMLGFSCQKIKFEAVLIPDKIIESYNETKAFYIIDDNQPVEQEGWGTIAGIAVLSDYKDLMLNMVRGKERMVININGLTTLST